MNMFKSVKANSVESYLASVPPDRRDAILFLHEFIQKCEPTLSPHFAYNMLGYGSFNYTNYKKIEQDWPIVSLANQKKYMSLYICAIIDGEYVAEKFKDDLGNVSVGKSCVRFKKLEDLNLDTIKKILRVAAKYPGLVATNKHQKIKK